MSHSRYLRSIMFLSGSLLLTAGAAIQYAHAAVDVVVQENTSAGITLRLVFNEYDFQTIEIDGREYQRLLLGKEPQRLDAGAPELPHVCRSVIIPDDAEMTLKVISRNYFELRDVDIAPSKGNLLRTVDPATVPYVFGAAYETDAFYPAEIAELGEPYILRDYRGAVIDINPFQYNPVTRTLRVYAEITVRLTSAESVGTTNVLTHRPQTLSAAFDQIYTHHFVNYTPVSRYAPLDETGEMLIICYDAWLGNIQPLVDHKNSIGIPTTAVGVSTIGNNATAIRNYIQNFYNTHDLAFVLLVGDAAEVATPTAVSGSSDPTYSLTAGSDNYPDIIVGRFSAQSAAQVDTQVLRTIEYELMPATEQAWFKRGVGIGSDEGPGDDGETDRQHIANIRTDLLNYGYTLVDGFYGTSATATQVANAVNAGRGIINYCGHGSTTAWSTTGFSVTNVNALVNNNMLPFIVSVACVNGQFNGYTCFAEAWLRATNGTAPTGAIGIYASSINQSWNPPMAAQDETVDLLCAEAYFSFGALCYAGSCLMMDEYGSGGVDMFLTWHVFGDPSVRVFGTAEPPRLTMTLPAGAPTIVPSGQPTQITLDIRDGEETYVPGSGRLHYRYGGGAYQTAALAPLGGNLYQATLPAADCDDQPRYYFSATGNGGTTIYLPADAPVTVYSAIVGTAVLIEENFFEQATPVWTVGASDDTATTGIWNRMDPVGTAAQPEDDHTPNGTMCWVTDGRGGSLGDYDVDGGKTTLNSPIFALADAVDPKISYWRWYSNNTGASPNADVFVVDISSNGGSTWTNVETVGPSGPETGGGWFYHEFHVRDLVPLTNQIKLRFVASDFGSGSIIEAAVDDFRIDDFICIDENPCFGDLDGDNDIDIADLSQLLAHYGQQVAGYEDGDLDEDGDVDIADLSALLAVYGTACPG